MVLVVDGGVCVCVFVYVIDSISTGPRIPPQTRCIRMTQQSHPCPPPPGMCQSEALPSLQIISRIGKERTRLSLSFCVVLDVVVAAAVAGFFVVVLAVVFFFG